MSTIHFIGGEKGGVGKSVFSRLFSQYCINNSIPYTGFDADQSHGTLSRFYQDYTQAVNLDLFESTDKIMEAALEQDQQILVDLPAQSERFLDRWVDENGVLDMASEMGMSFVYWYIVDDGTDSANLLENFLTKYTDHLHCVVVKNKGCGSNFTKIDNVLESAFNHTDKGVWVHQAVLPELHSETMRKIDELNFSFWGAEHLKDTKPHLSLMERQRTKVWLKKAYALFGNTLGGIIPNR
ncbi:MAG: Unknown protein [uncultured Thiotrichaceae bacterium]|uniref:Mobilization protein MobD n=1 Tax=uncultured Thiotrichaceae bacterium TaxID=298394 RepID=A0A6S6TGJ2_9GAMM|nr:MAG: Unknown protein [uncultured Thiotrichaceae bacterium]